MRSGELPEKAELELVFLDLKKLEIAGIPDQEGGELEIHKLAELQTSFSYKSKSLTFSGTCERAVIGGLQVLAKHDPDHVPPRGPRLFGHRNVFNSCLLLLQELGYSLKALGHSAHADYVPSLRWQATMPDGTDLTADTPIELLGLAALHRYHEPKIPEPYWWRIEGPPLLDELVEELKTQE